MDITVEIKLRCPSGFYCMRNASNKCSRLHFENNHPYCEVFYPFLETDYQGNVLKCEQCLLAERKERIAQ